MGKHLAGLLNRFGAMNKTMVFCLTSPLAKARRRNQETVLREASSPRKKILESYPTLGATAIQAVFAFAAECLKEDVFYTPLLSAEAG